MNNTFCLGIFLLLIYAKNLAWQFSAETISILFIEVKKPVDRRSFAFASSGLAWLYLDVHPPPTPPNQLLMAVYAHKHTHRLIDGIIIMSFYPLSLLLVVLLEGPGNID
jgi:hypothetical protein